MKCTFVLLALVIFSHLNLALESKISIIEKEEIFVAYYREIASSVNQDKDCPGGKTTCLSSETCCLEKDGSYGCCHSENAVCCTETDSCCPNSSVCCKKLDGQEVPSCCPVSYSVCCEDGIHCCPPNYKCMLQIGACVPLKVCIMYLPSSIY